MTTSLQRDSNHVPVLGGVYDDGSGTIAPLSINAANGRLKVTAILANAPTVSTGTAAPNSTPANIGDLYVDTTNHKLYFADGTASSSNWVIAN